MIPRTRLRFPTPQVSYMQPIDIIVPKLPGKIAAITLWPFVVYRRGHETDYALRQHELYHWQEALRWGVVPWYLTYIALLPFYGGGKNHPLEREAYALQYRLNKRI